MRGRISLDDAADLCEDGGASPPGDLMRHLLRSSPLLALLALAACAGAKAAAPAAAPAAATAPAAGPAATAATAAVSIPVGGMTCGGCARRVTNALRAVEGVRTAEVILAEKRAVVTFEPARVQPAALAAAVRDAGYEPGEPSLASAPEDRPAAVRN
jgi:copper chaperone CopZ